MNIEIITKEYLLVLKHELLNEIRALIGKNDWPGSNWIRSCEVKKLLKISPNTLQNLRVNGMLPYNKVGSIFYYKMEDINKMLDGKQ